MPYGILVLVEMKYPNHNKRKTRQDMRQTILLLSFLSLPLAAAAQETYQVSTDVQKRKILLEEFTGVNCGWCPEGHMIAQQLLNGMAGDAFAVNVHAGHYSTPSAGEPDYRTDEGTELAAYLKTSEAGYPCGAVNRYCYDGTNYLSGRSTWINLANYLHQDDAIVNLYLESTYDGTTGVLSIHVEGYYTGDVPTDSIQRLNVLWTQDDILGYQNGGNAGNEYQHNHMLRGYISPMWGDAIDGATKGQYFSKDYAYTLPEKVGDADVKPEDINVIAFVCEGRTNIENVAGGKPAYTNYNDEEAGELRSPEFGIGTRYGFNFFEVQLKNKSAKKISTATFEVTVNGNTETQTIDCDIDQFSTATVRIPATMSYASKGKTKYSVTLKELNGVSVEESSISGGYQKPASTNSSVTIEIATDYYASQNTFQLKDADGNVIEDFGPFDDGEQSSETETIEGLEYGKTYCFEIYDSYGDGLLEGEKGSLIVRSGAGKLIDQFYSISGRGIRSFFTVDIEDAIRGIEADDETNHIIYNVQGQQVSSTDAKGFYIIKQSNGKATKILTK